jgi:hypothetical protein
MDLPYFWAHPTQYGESKLFDRHHSLVTDISGFVIAPVFSAPPILN